MAYINFQNCTRQEYEQIIYSQKSKNKVRLIFGGNELLNADRYCEKITMSSRILPMDLSKRFSLDNFISKEITIILHDVNPNVITGQVNVLIGTLVDEENDIYEYVPLGIFNIQGSPITDKDKITITLRDNRIKFDFGYNAKPLIDMYGGTATKKQILDDICSKAGVICDTTTFLGENDEVGIYDNSITANVYISYIAEQAGMIAIITREGHLKFINVNNSTIWKIPLYLLEKYEMSKKYTVQRVVYESGIIKYQTSNDETLDTLYINSANPYIKDPEHINNIYQIINGFEVDSIKTGKVLGNPAIDPYDLIQIYGYYVEDEHGNKHFVDDDTVIVAQTLANCDFTYRKSMIAEYNTVIGEEERKENVTISGEATYRKYAKSEYDELNGSILLMAGQIDGQNTKIAQIQVSVDEINQKIGEVTDITVTAEDTDGQVELEGVNESEPIQIKIHPIGINISYDYPHNDYPQNDYSSIRTLRFIRSYTEEGTQKTEIIDYELPYDLLYYDQDNYDEFYLDYDSNTCYVSKKCVYNSDGTVGLLSTPQIIDIYPYPTINLGNGDYTVCLLGYSQAYLFVRLMASNIYTTQFATKVEMNSAINQTATEINLEVSRKVGNDEVISKINQSAEAITINANKISLAGKQINLTSENIVINSTNFSVNRDGNITAVGGTIGGWTLSNSALHTENNNYYLGTTGITATIGDTTVNNIIFKAGSKFGVSSGGTLYAQNAILNGATVSGTINATSGTFNGTVNASSGSFTGSLYSNNGTIGGWTLSSSGLSNSYSSINSNGELSLYPTTGGVYRIAQGAVRFNASGGIAIASSSNGSVYAGTGNLDIKGCSGHPVYIGCMSNSAGTIEKSCVSIENGLLAFRSTGYATYNGSTVWGSSSKATKENIKTLDDSDKDEVYKLIKQIPLISFDYKKQYSGQKNNYGFLIEDIENTKLKTLLHINQSETNKDIKTYSTEDLTRLELVVIQELMKKVERLEALVNG